MDQTFLLPLALLATIVLFLAGGVWVAISLLAGGLVTLLVFTPAPGSLLVSSMWDASKNWALTALPLFIWMGEILFRSRLASDMFEGLAPWMNSAPGRLLHFNIVGCGIMAAVTGSSAATTATIGRMSVPELRKRGYSENMMIGTLAGSGTLGLLIPPSIVMIVYGVTAQQSVARLFIAGIIPGILLVLVYIGYVVVWALLNPTQMPDAEPPLPFWQKLRYSAKLISVVLLIILVIGSIYGGYATPTEAATVGVAGALLLALVSRGLTFDSFMKSLMGATRTSCMIAFIIASAAALTTAVGYVQIPQNLAAWVDSLGLDRYMLLVMLAFFLLVMGCFLEGISIIVLSSSVMLPMMQTQGISLLWFGVFLTILIEAAQITPPVGFNLFVLQSLSDRDIWKVNRATIPFFVLLMVVLVVISLEPGLVTWLPRRMMSSY